MADDFETIEDDFETIEDDFESVEEESGVMDALSDAATWLQEGSNTLISNLFLSIPGTESLGTLFGMMGSKPEKGDEDRSTLEVLENRAKKVSRLQKRISEQENKKSPAAALYGKSLGTSAALVSLPTTGLTGKIAQYSYLAAESLENSLQNSVEKDMTPEDTMRNSVSNMFEDVSTAAGIDVALAMMPSAIKALYKMAPDPVKKGVKGASKKLQDSGIKLMQKFTDLNKAVKKGKISKEQGTAAAREVIEGSPFLPSIRGIDRKITKDQEVLKDSFSDLYGRANKMVDNKPIVNLDGIPSQLREKSKVYREELATDLADGLDKTADIIENDLLKSNSIMKTWAMTRNLGKKGFKQSQGISDEASVIARSHLKERLDGAMGAHVKDNKLLNKLKSNNKKATNLFTAQKSLTPKALQKGSSLVPSATDSFLLGAAPFSDIAAIFALTRVGGRVGKNLAPGLAAKLLYKSPDVARAAKHKYNLLQQAPTGTAFSLLKNKSESQE